MSHSQTLFKELCPDCCYTETAPIYTGLFSLVVFYKHSVKHFGLMRSPQREVYLSLDLDLLELLPKMQYCLSGQDRVIVHRRTLPLVVTLVSIKCSYWQNVMDLKRLLHFLAPFFIVFMYMER